MNFRTFCSGIGSPELAWSRLGWSCLSSSEIDQQCNAVLAHHFPGVPNLGDMTTIGDIGDAGDVWMAGTPCQDYSVAGLRAGMDGANGQLAFVFLRLLDRFRPRWLVWENVPGVLSSNGGRDFGAFLGGLAECGYGWAYRVLDAQYVRVESHPRAVPQRRRRVFVVGHLGDWRRAAAVLLEREGMRWNHPPSRAAGEGTAHAVAPCFSASRARIGETRGQDPVVSHCLNAGAQGRQDFESETLVTACFDERNVTSKANRSTCDPAVSATNHASPMAIAFNWQSGGSAAMLSPRSTHTDALNSSQTVAVCVPSIASTVVECYNHAYANAEEARSGEALRVLLQASGEEAFLQWCLGVLAALWPQEVLRLPMYGWGIRREAFSFKGIVYLSLSRSQGCPEGSVRTLWKAGCDGCPPQGWGHHEQHAEQLGTHLSELPQSPSPAQAFMSLVRKSCRESGLVQQALSALAEARRSESVQKKPELSGGVRRLVEEECEALQGFPRGYTAVPYKGKPMSGAARYRMLGNSIAVNCMSWIGQRIAVVESIKEAAHA